MSALNHIRIHLLIALAALCLWLPPEAYAVSPLPAAVDDCAGLGAAAAGQPAPGDSDYTSKVVYCVQYTVVQATNTFLSSFSGYMTTTVAAMFTFALIMFGIHMLAGPDQMKTKTAAFVLRLGIVGMFSANLGSNSFLYPGGMVQAVFDIEQQMVGLVTKSTAILPAACPFYTNGQLDPSCVWSPWSQIDLFLGMLLGFAPCPLFDLTKGLIGIVAASLLTSTIGIGVFLAGIMGLLEVVLFIFDVVYVYLTAILVIGFLLAISPLIVPLAVFFYSEKYVTKWLNMLIAAMITPVLLFAFLSLFVGIFNVFISNIFTILGATCPPIPPANLCNCTINFSSFWRTNVKMFSWFIINDPNTEPLGGRLHPGMPAALNPALGFAADMNLAAMPKLDFGSKGKNWIIQSQLIFSFISLWVFASIIKDIALRIPQVAESIASSVSGISMQPSPLTKMIKGEKGYDKFERDPREEDPKAPGGGGG